VIGGDKEGTELAENYTLTCEKWNENHQFGRGKFKHMSRVTNYDVATWRTVHPEKLTDPSLLKKRPAF
jgi:hypothetical protein